MNKSELVQTLASRASMTKAQASRVVDALFNPKAGIIAQTVKKGDRVAITGFGTFETRTRQGRVATLRRARRSGLARPRAWRSGPARRSRRR